MSVNPNNLTMGPSFIYTSPTGTAEPADSAVTPDGYLTPPASPWVDVGGTESGVSFDIEDTITDLEVDQIIMPVGGRLTKRMIQVTTTMAEMTLANLNLAMNQGLTIGEEGSFATADMSVGTSATQLPYTALCIYGWAPLLQTGRPALRRIIVRKVLSQPKVTLDYEQAKKGTVAVTWKAYYISSGLSPIHITDALV